MKTILFLILFATACTKPSDTMTARFFCDEPNCSVWYGVYDTDMRRDVTGNCWQQTIDIEPGATLMLNCETGSEPAMILLAVYCGDECVAFGQAGVEAHSSGEILIKNE